jgi:hypothetical protein
MFEGLLLTLAIPALFSILYYAIGSPNGIQNANAILFSYTRFLVRKRLERTGLFETVIYTNTSEEDVILKRQGYLLDLDRALPLFTYENAIGMCPTCSYVWFSALFLFLPLLALGHNFLVAISLTMISNVISKIFIKYI